MNAVLPRYEGPGGNAARPYAAAPQPRVFAAAWSEPGPIERLINRFETLTVAYVIALSAGALGFIDIIVTGSSHVRQDTSLFARLQWPMIYMVFTALAWINGRQIMRAALLAWPILLWPALAAVSFAWSVDPTTTAGQVIRFSMTVLIGILIGSRFTMTELLKIVFVVTLAGVGVSALLGLAGIDFALAPDGDVRGVYFHKNMLGGQADLLLAVSVVLLFAGWRVPLASIGALTALVAVAVSDSATAAAVAAFLIVGVPCLAAMALRPIAALTITMIALFVVCFAALAFVHAGTDPYTFALHLLDRDPTLTGRSDLWAAGLAQFWDRPLFGAGFGAFWTAAVDWRTEVVLSELGDVMHFHNSFLEVAVQLGFIGLAAVVAVLVWMAWMSLAELLRSKSVVLTWPLALWSLMMIAGMAEVVFFTKHALFQILMVAAFTQVVLFRNGRRSGAGVQP